MIKLLFSLISPLFNRFVWLVANGPWPSSIHSILIAVFRKLYKIETKPEKRHKKLSQFFLRDRIFTIDTSELVSPVQSYCLDAGRELKPAETQRVKGVDYAWKEFPEFDAENFRGAYFWNFYLAPSHYHWFHAPCSGTNIRAYRFSGKTLPVNALGRIASKRLFLENERLSFRWTHPIFGEVLLLCVGALGVCRIRSELGPAAYGAWTPLSKEVSKAQRLGAFELGSSALLIVQRLPEKQSPISTLPELEVGQSLLKPH